MKNKVFLTIITLLLVAVLAVQVVTLVKISGFELVSEQVEMEDEADSEADPGVKIDTSVVQVDTPYGILKYPSIWIDEITVEDVKLENGVDTVVFSGLVNGKKGELFTVIFGTEHDDIYIGDIEHNGKTVRVGIQMAFIDETAWTAEEYKTLCDMQKAKDQVQQSILE